MEKALIYCRVSTEEQAKDGRLSLKTQQNLCEKAVEANDKYVLAIDGVFIDAGKSATNMNRAGLQDMLIRVDEDEDIGAVFVLDTDRLARNALDHMTIKALLEKKGVKLFSVSQPGIENTPEGNFMDLIIAGVNQRQTQITSRKTLKSMEQKFNDGWWVTRAPIGYFNAGEKENSDKRIITIDPTRAPLIAEAFKMYSTGGYSVLDIRDALYKKGFVTSSGKMPAISLMYEILECPFYYGEMRWRGLIKMGKHKPIITREQFERCQQVKAEHNRFACRKRKYDFLLRGFLFSAVSGLRLTGEHHPEKKKSYYRCYPKNGKMPVAEDKGVPLADVESVVEDEFCGIEFSSTFIEKVAAKVQSIYDRKRQEVGGQKSSLLATRANLERKLETAEEKLISGVLNDADFTKIKNRYREQIAGVDDEIGKLERNRNIKVDVIQQVLALCRNIGETYKAAPYELKRLYLGLFWDRFEVSGGKLVNAIPSKIIRALAQTGSVCLNKKQKPIPIAVMFAKKSLAYRQNVQITNLRGAVVEDVRTVFERINDTTIYIPELQPVEFV